MHKAVCSEGCEKIQDILTLAGAVMVWCFTHPDLSFQIAVIFVALDDILGCDPIRFSEGQT